MHRIIFIFLQFLSISFVTNGQAVDSLKAHIDSSFTIMQHSLYSNKIDWAQEKAIAYQAAKNITTKEKLFPVIAAVYKKLDDRHGWFEQYNDKVRLPMKDTRQPTSNMLKEWAKGPAIIAKMINGIAYLRLPGMHVTSPKQIDYTANWLADSVKSLASKNPKAWIIDLRLNTGGNIMPMMSGLASFFEEGIISYYLNSNDEPVSRAAIKNKVYVQDETLVAHLKVVLPDLSKQKVAVLMGRATGSSGEGVAYNFLNRKRTRLFGENSAGVANATEGFVFNNDQSYFLLTTSKLGNRYKKPAPETLQPHVQVPVQDDFEVPEKDVTVIKALRWLRRS